MASTELIGLAFNQSTTARRRNFHHCYLQKRVVSGSPSLISDRDTWLFVSTLLLWFGLFLSYLSTNIMHRIVRTKETIVPFFVYPNPRSSMPQERWLKGDRSLPSQSKSRKKGSGAPTASTYIYVQNRMIEPRQAKTT